MKYHLGHSNDWPPQTGRKSTLTLCFNPSHLEFVNPVAWAAAGQAGPGRRHRHEQGLAILIHGDAAFAGEGIVQETLNLASCPATPTAARCT